MRSCLRILHTLVVFHGHNIEYHLLDSTKVHSLNLQTRLERREQTRVTSGKENGFVSFSVPVSQKSHTIEFHDFD
ncbi:hypothetical protein TorRG33x02_061590 [Trema orientale]|uniref:Uncharacterized protein n=1 Tax=Trema orientale TaxID=63057 RepID=A0A2P5FJW5_TREOI|nr:hypothetical protein TorRG33x02_061590 [Trema orientale]